MVSWIVLIIVLVVVVFTEPVDWWEMWAIESLPPAERAMEHRRSVMGQDGVRIRMGQEFH